MNSIRSAVEEMIADIRALLRDVPSMDNVNEAETLLAHVDDYIDQIRSEADIIENEALALAEQLDRWQNGVMQ